MSNRFRLKIRAGETFLYRKGGTESQVFEVRMKENIHHNSLYLASRLAYKRYPYFKSRFKVIDGSVYLCEKCMNELYGEIGRYMVPKNLKPIYKKGGKDE